LWKSNRNTEIWLRYLTGYEKDKIQWVQFVYSGVEQYIIEWYWYGIEIEGDWKEVTLLQHCCEPSNDGDGVF